MFAKKTVERETVYYFHGLYFKESNIDFSAFSMARLISYILLNKKKSRSDHCFNIFFFPNDMMKILWRSKEQTTGGHIDFYFFITLHSVSTWF